MSGIYISGMKMPDSCYDCDMLKLSGAVGCKHAYDKSNSEWGRALNCPLISVPDHGLVIDADAPIEVWDVQFPSGKTTVSKLLLSKVIGKIPPTIIPADKDLTNK